MNRRILWLALWLLLPVPVLVLHMRHGGRWLALDQARNLIRQADAAEQRGAWPEAQQLYRQARGHIARDNDRLQMALNLAESRIFYQTGDGNKAVRMIESILDDPRLAEMPPEMRHQARELAGHIHYRAAWLMRIKEAPRDMWMKHADRARQNFRMLAEAGPAEGMPSAQVAKQTENLEHAVRLQRMSLADLMAKPPPRQGNDGDGGGQGDGGGGEGGGRSEPNETKDSGPENSTMKCPGADRFNPGKGT